MSKTLPKKEENAPGRVVRRSEKGRKRGSSDESERMKKVILAECANDASSRLFCESERRFPDYPLALS